MKQSATVFNFTQVLWLLALLFFPLSISGQDIYTLQDPGNTHIDLNAGWKYKMIDDLRFAQIEYDDKDWKEFQPAGDIVEDIPSDAKAGVGWTRLRFKVDSKARNQKFAMIVRQSVASEIYLNGRLIKKYGVISENPDEIKAFDPRWEPVQFTFSADSIQVLAVRFAVQPEINYSIHYGVPNPVMFIKVMTENLALDSFKEVYMRPWIDLFMQGMIFMVFVVHLCFFIMYPAQRANLFFALAALSSVVGAMIHNLFYYGAEPEIKFFTAVMASILHSSNQLFSFLSIQSYLKEKTGILFWILLLIVGLSVLTAAIWYGGFYWMLAYTPIISGAFVVFLAVRALKNGVREARILIFGFIIATIGFILFLSNAIYKAPYDHLLISLFDPHGFFFMIFTLAPPTSVSIFLARDFATTSRRLQQKLTEVEKLSEKNVAVEKEKQEILASQNETLEKQVTERTSQLKKSLEDLRSTQTQLIQSEKMASLGELTAGIAHEIQNPLNFVNNFSELNKELIDELLDKANAGNLGDVQKLARDIKQNEVKIEHHGKRADAIVKNMLQHSRSSSGQKELTDINALCDEYLRLTYHGFRAKDKSFNAELITNFDSTVPKVTIVRQEIGRVIMNLINNAMYAVHQKSKQSANGHQPTVIIATKNINGKVEIRVHDNGNGMTSAVKEKIFQPFFTTKPTGEGTGLGLSLAYDIITKAHSGEINVETKEGEGSEFIIRLLL